VVALVGSEVQKRKEKGVGVVGKKQEKETRKQKTWKRYHKTKFG
jgi:hypothetical protein